MNRPAHFFPLHHLASITISLLALITAATGDGLYGQDVSSTTPAAKITPDLVYGHKDGLALTMDLYEPDGTPNGAGVLFMVSGGWYSVWAPPEKTRPMLEPFLKEGFKVIAVRHGSSPRYTIPEAVHDVQQAVRFVRRNAERFGVDAERLGVFGMSAGGHLSLMLGTTGDDGTADAPDDSLEKIPSRVAAVVAFVPPTDLRVAVWEAPESLPAYRNFPALNLEMQKAEQNSPLVHVTPDDAPALVVMGGDDQLVPPRHGEWIDKAFHEQKVTSKLIIVPHAGHNLGSVQDQQQAFAEAVAWFKTYLARR